MPSFIYIVLGYFQGRFLLVSREGNSTMIFSHPSWLVAKVFFNHRPTLNSKVRSWYRAILQRAWYAQSLWNLVAPLLLVKPEIFTESPGKAWFTQWKFQRPKGFVFTDGLLWWKIMKNGLKHRRLTPNLHRSWKEIFGYFFLYLYSTMYIKYID